MRHLIMACVMALFPGLAASARMDGPVARYTFEEASGDVVHDKSGNGNNGRKHGAKFLEGKSGSALRFNGETDYVDFGNPPGLKFADAVTITAWVYPQSVPAQHALIVDEVAGGRACVCFRYVFIRRRAQRERAEVLEALAARVQHHVPRLNRHIYTGLGSCSGALNVPRNSAQSPSIVKPCWPGSARTR